MLLNNSNYMFLNYNDNFPICVSVQNNRRNLARLHFHEDVEILKVTAQEVDIQIGNKILRCSESDILFFYPNTLHQVTAPNEDSEVKAIMYRDEILKFPIDYSYNNQDFRIFKKEDPCYDRLNNLFLKAMELPNQKDKAYEVEMTACLLEITAIFIKEGILSIGTTNNSKKILKPAFEYIEQNSASSIKIEDLAKILNFSKEHIIRLFKSETGKTPAEYIIDFKVKKAMNMLMNEELSITQISEDLGFANPSHFSKVFKNRLKITPSEYRNEHLN